jgi:hypothetical protein
MTTWHDLIIALLVIICSILGPSILVFCIVVFNPSIPWLDKLMKPIIDHLEKEK